MAAWCTASAGEFLHLLPKANVTSHPIFRGPTSITIQASILIEKYQPLGCPSAALEGVAGVAGVTGDPGHAGHVGHVGQAGMVGANHFVLMPVMMNSVE